LTSSPTTHLMNVRLGCAAVLAVLAVAVAGCGGSETTQGMNPAISADQLVSSAETSAAATSGRFSFDLSATLPGADDPFSLSGEGAFDSGSKRASIAFDMSSLAKLLGGFFAGLAGPNAKGLPDFDDPDGWKVRVIRDGDVSYVRLPALDAELPRGKSWIRGDERATTASGFDVHDLERLSAGDPRDVLDALRAVTGDVETMGTEKLRGVETTHYHAIVDPAELAARAAGNGGQSQGTLFEGLTTQSGLGDVPADVWLDASGLVRKLTLAFEATDPNTAQPNTASVTFELWDYGRAVASDLPPPSQVVDASSLHG
jgi:hypothetical protein